MSNMASAMEMESPRDRKAGRPGVEEIGYEYKPVDWKSFFTKAKYIREVSCSIFWGFLD